MCDLKVKRMDRSGNPIPLPIILEPPIDATATQGNDGIGAADSPEHAGLLQTRSDHGLAASFNHTGANESSFLTKLRITHPAGVGFEGFGLFQDLGRQVSAGIGMFSGNLT